MNGRRRPEMESFDYVIVGAGAAGCVLANRLSEDPGCQVLLLEAGGEDRHPFIHMPKGIGRIARDPDHIWAFSTEPEAATGGMPERWGRGRVLGGSTAINGMVWVRGQPADFDAFAESAGPDWSWPHIAAAYRELEGRVLGDNEDKVGQGPLRITMPKARDPLSRAMMQAAQSLGLPLKADVNAPDAGMGVGPAARTIGGGIRQSAARAFLHPVRHRPNLVVRTGVVVDRVDIVEGRARSVVARRGGGVEHYGARREIILSAGSLASPAILQRSGVGPRALLEKLGVPIAAAREQVGANLREHRALLIQWRVPDAASQNRDHGGWRLLLNALRYYLTRTGILSAATYEVRAAVDLDGEGRPDAQLLFAPFSRDYEAAARGEVKMEENGGMHVCAYVLRPESRGSLEIRSTDPDELPSIRPNYRATDSDRHKMIELVRYIRRLVAQPAFAPFKPVETRPGPGFESDEAVLDAYDRMGGCAYHASGTCRAGWDPESVVDGALRVRGVSSLRVVDLSVFPEIPSGNTNGPVTALAWRAADIITFVRG